jgi:hypothetical protein
MLGKLFVLFISKAKHRQLITGYAQQGTNTKEKQISLSDKLNSCETGLLLIQVIFKVFDMLLIDNVLVRVMSYLWANLANCHGCVFLSVT